ncbi:unnamed protein product [Gongylonema pulchrum]|uniref:Pept_C1 domain-containing protein n=1 Tax=Gongylonema pulchrum TaxID=637853 RepID=A0A183ER83_9BILA|nr:unnamed protein product [Gongylonema pulchrum]
MDTKYLEPHAGMKKYEPPANDSLVRAGQRLDFRQYVTPVRNQGQCGSCWAFATIANLEYLYKRSTGRDYDYSEQALLDCDTRSYGCRGGFPSTALELMAQRGVPLETEYARYAGVQGPCRLQYGRGTISRSVSIPAGFQSIQSYLANHGPFVGSSFS